MTDFNKQLSVVRQRWDKQAQADGEWTVKESTEKTIYNSIKAMPNTVSLQADGDLISRQAVLETIEDCNKSGLTGIFCSYQDGKRFEQLINELPSVTIPNKTGHWIADVDKWGDVVTTVNGYRCDKCNAFNSDKDNFCPNCGAKMEGEQDG